MKQALILFINLVFFILTIHAEVGKDDILLEINDRKITKDEFLRIYNKNNNANTVDNKSISEYLDLFINFKLKVIEAEELGYDTLPSFISEFEGYKKELVKPYLTNKEVEESLITEAYERMKEEINASHILISVAENASPEDTLKAYEKIMAIRERILNGEPFDEVARATSDDPSAKNNGGNLGYFTAFNMIYPFESAAYKTGVEEVSMPVRTKYGYHIIQVNDRRPARGEIKVAHIMKIIPPDATEEQRDSAQIIIEQIYERIKNGEDFAQLADEYSDHKQSARKGGELPWFSSTGRMIESFADASFALTENGQVSEPVKTAYGWHIIKRLDKKDIGSFEELKPEIAKKITQDPHRNMISQEVVIKNLKKEYNFKENKANADHFFGLVDSTILQGNWNPKLQGLDKVLFTFAEKKYTERDFAEYLMDKQRARSRTNINTYLNKQYSDFVQAKLLEYEESQLEVKYPEYKYLLEEYHDGILLFNLTDELVWSKAVKDTAGLKEFYENHKSEYMWDVRADAVVVITGKSDDMFKKAKKYLKKEARKMDTITSRLIKDALCDTIQPDCVEVQTGTFLKDENDYVKSVDWKAGSVQSIELDGKDVLVLIRDEIPPTIKKLDEARGLITADYQNYLEKEWIKDLREKYKIVIHEDILKTIL